ncbi:MAG: TMEM175 family protein [Bacteroidota bacterium]|nr:TMEM175 family protein [Bacteroidota bacterium]MDP4229855.1 TMEM175 family protein [Bacteroidota bacterium]
MPHSKQLGKERLVFFSDAILAIIVTILVLDIKVPIVETGGDAELTRRLIVQAPHLVAFVLSFAVIIVLWYSHNRLMGMVDTPTNTFGVINFLFIGVTATIPFTTALVGEYPGSSVAAAMLAANMLLMNIFITLCFVYAMKKNLVGKNFVFGHYDKMKRIMGIIGTFLFLGSIFVAFLSPVVSLVMIAAVPIMHCLPIKRE